MAKKNWKIVNVDDFVIFKASDDIIEETNSKYEQANRINQIYIDKHPQANPKKPISGTFICAQPPNYRGVPMHHATADDWCHVWE